MRLEEIRKRYNISSDNLDEIKSQLKIKIRESHPDNNDIFDSDYFSDLNNDLSYVEDLIKNSESQNTLVPMTEVMQMFAKVLQMPAKKNEDPKEVLSVKLSENIQSRLLKDKRRLWTPRISSATMMALITFLWLFPDKVMAHPLIQIVFGDSRYATVEFALCITAIWLIALMFVTVIWSYSIRRERMEKDIMGRIKLESVQNEIFMNFLSSISSANEFSKLDFMEYLAYGLSKEQKRKIILRFKADEEIIQNMADIILLRAKEYGVIKTIKSHSLIDSYEIVKGE